MNTAYTLGKTCVACGQNRAKKNIAYDPNTFYAYCANPWVCPAGKTTHINSPANIVKNQGETNLLPLDKAQELYTKHLENTLIDNEVVDRVRKMVEHPTSVRLVSPEMAMFLVQLQKDLSLSSISDTIKYCIEQLMDQNREYLSAFKANETDKAYQQEVKKVQNEVQHFVTHKTSKEMEEETEDLVF